MKRRRAHFTRPAVLLMAALGFVGVNAGPAAQVAFEEAASSEAEADAGGESLPPALANPILQEYFRRQAHERLFVHDPRGFQTPGRERFIESYVERQILHFVQQLREKMDSLQRSLLHLNGYLEWVGRVGADGSGKGERRERLKQELRSIEGNAEEIRRMLSFVFLGLNRRDRFRASIEAESRRSGYVRELEQLEQWIEETDREISHYLFVPSNVVTVESLQQMGMLVLLQRIRDLARKVREEL